MITKIKCMSSGKILLSVVAGLSVGALLGVLFAPKKGTELRKDISKKGMDYSHAVKDKFSEVVDAVTGKYEHAKDGVRDFAQKGNAKPDFANKV
jgi:gas vesicle protein